MARLMAVTLCAAAGFLAAAAATTLQTSDTAATRAIAYLSREVPAWRRDHPCYSCHNNGDAARALIAAAPSAATRAALADTLGWLAAPDRWATNGGGEGGGDDKRLARIQFAHATTAAAAASLLDADAVRKAAALILDDQLADGSWQLDSSDSIGSPATYGTALATVFSRRTIVAAGAPAGSRAAAAVARADAWLADTRPSNAPDAAAVLFAAADAAPPTRPANVDVALGFFARGQGRNGGWGPYVTSPAEPFDTALAVLALEGMARRKLSAEPAFTPDALTDAIAQGRRYLLAAQLEDGSWQETTRPAGQASYAQRISTTGWALLALTGNPKR
jgi:hypothetical protein